MISGNIEKFNSPIRQFTGKVELCGKGSIPTSISGNPITFDDAVPGSMIDIQLTSDTITDFSNIGTEYGKNLFNIAVLEHYPTVYNAEDNTITIKSRAQGFSKNGIALTLKDYAPGLEVGKTYYLSANYSHTGNYFWLSGYNKSWAFGTKATITQKMLDSSVLWYNSITVDGSDTTLNVIGNIQIEEGDVATAYEPYSATPIPVEVKRGSKNLIDYTKATGRTATQKVNIIENGIEWVSGDYYFQIPCNIKKGETVIFSCVDEANAFSTIYLADSKTQQYCSKSSFIANPTAMTATADADAIFIYKYNPGEDIVEPLRLTNLQLEYGTVATAYEPYKEPVVAAADKDGKLSIPSLLGINYLSSNSDVEINATYQKQLSADNATFTHNGDLVKFVVDKTGENKFFGYGVCQKIEVEVRDKDRQYNPSNNHYLQVSLDDKVVFPLFYITDTKRNENTNGLTITAYDFIAEASKHTWDELEITNLTMTNIASVIGAALGACNVLAEYDEFFGVYEEINVEGTETWREILDDIAEATQTIYFVNSGNELVFKRLDMGDPVYTIDKSQYFTLKSEPSKTLTAIVSATELGDNVIAGTTDGETQYVRDNAFWTFSQDIEQDVETALANVSGLTITPFNCSWRGNYLLEIGDKIGLVGKDNEIIETYLLTDKLTYMGGLKQNTQWAYKSDNSTAANPSTLGEVLKQTYAKVDKANKQIEMVVSETSTNRKDISDLRIETDAIRASVGSMETITSTLNDEVSTLTNKVELAMTDEQVDIKIQSSLSNGVDKVKTTDKNYTFDDEGLSISSSDSNISTTITEDGMTVKMNDNDVLTANNEGVKAIDLHATTFLIIGKNSRFEDYGSRTACFWIGG
jgi:hypothetical protein